MRELLLLFAPLVLAFAALAQRSIIVGVPSAMDAETGKTVYGATMELVFEASAGDRVCVYDATNGQRISDIRIPAMKQGTSRRARAVRLKGEIAQLKSFFQKVRDVDGPDKERIMLPQFLDLVGKSLAATAGDVVVVLFGSPFYVDNRDPAASYGQGYVPSDGYILATSLLSVFGTADRNERLRGCTVHFCHLRADIFTSELERVHLRRFLKLFVGGLGGTLSTFSPSADLVVERALQAKDPVTNEVIDRNDVKLEMRKIVTHRKDAEQNLLSVRETKQVEATSEQEQAAPAAPPAPAVQAAPAAQAAIAATLARLPEARNGFIDVTVVWVADGDSSRADVDLWIRPNPKATELCFLNQGQATADGTYLRDIRHADSAIGKSGWEAAAEAVELRRTGIDHPTCWLNLYRGSGGVIHGIVRVATGSDMIDVPFSFPAIAGDGARGAEQRESSACWIEVPLRGL